MPAIWIDMPVVAARRRALLRLDPLVRATLLEQARAWTLPAAPRVTLTVYERVWERAPARGGHWTLYAAAIEPDRHDLATLTVTAEFEGDQPVDLCVAGAANVVAGDAGAAALREALNRSGGPLRQLIVLRPPVVAAPRPG
jgi:hypothetical protein